MLKNLIIKNRTIRRFCQNETIDMDLLRGFVDLARLGPSAKNAQPLKYIIVNDAKTNAEVFANLVIIFMSIMVLRRKLLNWQQRNRA